MFVEAKLLCDGKFITVITCNYGFKRAIDASNRPCGAPLLHPIELTIEAQKSSTLTEWAIAPHAPKQIAIYFYPVHRNGKILKLFLYDCNLVYLSHSFKAEGTEPMLQTLKIVAEGVKHGTAEKEFSTLFRETFSNSVFDTITPENIVLSPHISTLQWLDATTKTAITETHYTSTVCLTTRIQNPNGNTVQVSITKKDGTEFEHGKKELTFSEILDENGTFELTSLEIKEQWQDFKQATIDELVAKVSHSGVHKNSTPLQIVPPPKVIVDFRPSKNYDGEYGFDYMRDKNTKDDKLTYKDILGENYEYDKTKKEWIEKFTTYTTDTKYNDLKDNHYKTITFPWYKDSKGKEIEYIQSWLTMYPNQTVTLSLQIETIENPKKLDLTFEYDKSLFKLNTHKIPAQSKGKKRLKDHLTIECLKEFSTDQTIKVMYGNRQLGQLNILANAKAKRKKAEVVFVKVKTNLTGSSKDKEGKLTNKKGKKESTELIKFLKQGLVTANITEVDFNLTATDATTKKPKYPNFNKDFTIINSKGLKILNKYHNTIKSETLVNFVESAFNKANPTYANHFKVFFFGDRGGKHKYKTVLDPKTKKKVKKKDGIKGLGGYAKGIKSQAVIVFSGRNDATTTHELLHAIGLYHSFEYEKDFSYKKGDTYNIMDYSHLSGYGSKKRNHIWLWQIKKLWANTTNIKPE